MRILRLQYLFVSIIIWAFLIDVLRESFSIIHILALLSLIGLIVTLLLKEKKKSIAIDEAHGSEKNKIEYVYSTIDSVEESIDYSTICKNVLKLPDIKKYTRSLLLEFSKNIELSIGFYYSVNTENQVKVESFYAVPEDFEIQESYTNADGIIEQVILDKTWLIIPEIPEDYPSAFSGLGVSTPTTILFIPYINNSKCEGVFELGFFRSFSELQIQEFFNAIQELKLSIHE